jgi:hypothetical protein
MSGVQKEMVTYKYYFNEDERADNAQSLAQATVAKAEIEDEKKAVMSEYKAKIDAQVSLLNLISRHVIDGYTTKSKYAVKRKNFADAVWEWVDEDTGEIIKTETLSPKDRQQDIPFQAPEAAPKDDTVSVDGEDLNNGHEAVVNADGTGYFLALPNQDPKALPSGEEPSEENPTDEPASDEEKDDEGLDFDADKFNPEEESTPPPTTGKKPRRPRKP